MTKHFILLIPILFSFIIVSSACSESATLGTLKIVLQNPESKNLTNQKTIEPPESAKKSVKYTVSGIGPGNKTFSKDSASKTITVDGLPIGDWNINAKALSNNGIILFSGNKTIKHSKASETVTIPLMEEKGTGNLELALNWNININNGSVQIELNEISDEDKEETEIIAKTYSIPENSTSFSVSLKELKSGFYIMKITLLSGNSTIHSLLDALQIVNSATSSAQISFSQYNSDFGIKNYSNSIFNQTKTEIPTTEGYSITGSISDSNNNLSDILSADSVYQVNFNTTSGLETKDSIIIDWYIDGKIKQSQPLNIGQKNSFSFKADTGEHIISCIITNKSKKQCSGFLLRYFAALDTPKGVAKLAEIIPPSNAKEINLSISTTISLLPENRILILTPTYSSLQVAKINQNGIKGISLDNAIKNTYGKDDFHFLTYSKKIFSSENFDYILITDGINTANLLKTNVKKGKISAAIRVPEETIVNYNGTFSNSSIPVGNINFASFLSKQKYSSDIGIILFTDSLRKDIFLLSAVKEGINKESSIKKNDYFYTTQAFCTGSNKLYYVSGNTLFAADFDELQNSSSNNTNVFTSLTDFSTYITDNENLLDNRIYKILIPKNDLYTDTLFLISKTCIYKVQIDTLTSMCVFLEKTDIQNTDVCITPDGEYLYAVSSDGTLYSIAANFAGYFKILQKSQTNVHFKQILATEKNVIALDTNGILYVYEISEEL